jgi:hypothetical protein
LDFWKTKILLHDAFLRDLKMGFHKNALLKNAEERILKKRAFLKVFEVHTHKRFEIPFSQGTLK